MLHAGCLSNLVGIGQFPTSFGTTGKNLVEQSQVIFSMVPTRSRSSIHPFSLEMQLTRISSQIGDSAVCGVHGEVTKVIIDDEDTKYASSKSKSQQIPSHLSCP